MTDDELLAGVLRRYITDEMTYIRLEDSGYLLVDGCVRVSPDEMEALVMAGASLIDN